MQNFRAKPGTPMAGRRRAGPRRADDRLRDRAAGDGAGDEHPGPAEPVGRLRPAAAVGHQRLGRGLPPHPRLRQPRGALADIDGLGRSARTPATPCASASRSTPSTCATTTSSTRACATTPAPMADADGLAARRGAPPDGGGAGMSITFCRTLAGARPPSPGGPASARPPASTTPPSRGPGGGPAAGRDRPRRRRRLAWVVAPPQAMALLGRGVGGWRITVRHEGAARRRARRPGAHRRGVPAHRPRPASRRPSSWAGCRASRRGLGGGRTRSRRPSTRSPPAPTTWSSATGTPPRSGALRDAVAPRPLVERTALPPETEIDDARDALARPLFTAWLARSTAPAWPGRGTRGPRARRGAAGPGAAPVGRVGGRRLARRRPPTRACRASPPTWRASSSARWRAPRRGSPRSSGSSGPAGPRSRPSPRSPTPCASGATATP